MAGNKQRFTYEINADIGQAKKAISDLQQSIEKLSKAQINTNYLDKGINNAVTAAKELEYHLSAALNQNTGKLNLNAFTSSLEQSNISAKDLMQTLLQGGSAGQQTFASLANAIAQSEVPLRRANKTLQDFTTTLKNTVKWEISSTMVHGLESALSGAVSYAKNLNTSLTNIRIVTGQSVDDMARFAKEANVAAKALSTTTKSYADASLIYYQQGDSAEMAAKKAAITIKAANSSFETSAKEMSEYLTSVWNSYQVGADELERYVDIMANLGAKTATSLEEIATSMQKVAATANTVGVSMEQVSSIIATVSSVTRESAESIGTSYKTIFARIGDLKLGGVDEDGVGLGQVSSQLESIGVKILDESGNLREMGDIIMDLGTKWQTMNQAQKTAVAQVVAGKRQYTQLMALFENWDMFQGNMNIAENSEGALQKMADTYAESWEAASARVQASMEAIYGQVLNDEFIIKLTNGFASITDGISKMISGFGGLSGVLLHTGAIGTKVFQKQIASSIDQAKDSVTTFFSQFKNNSAKDVIGKLFHGDVKSVEAIKFTENTNKWKQDLEMASRQAKISGESDIKVRENAEVILTLKQSLLDAENQLSTAQMQRAQQELAYLSQEQDGLVQILRQKEERAKIEKQYAAQARVAISRANPDMSDNQYKDLTTQSDKAFGDINKKYEQVGVISNALDGLKSGVYDVNKAFELLNQEIQDPENKAKLQQMRQEIDALDDSEKITELEEKLKKLSRTLQQSAAQDLKEFKKALGQAFEGNQDILDKIDRIFDQTVENAREKGEDAGEAYARGLKVGVLRSNFEQLITEKLDPKKLDSFGGKVSQVANAALDLSSFVYAAGNAVSVLGDESSTTGEKMYALIGIISGVGEAITGLGALAKNFGPWGAIIGAAVTAGAAFFTVKDEIEKNQREQYEKEFEVTSSRSSDRVSKVTEEEKELQTLLSTYNDLYQRYKAGEDVQNELSASASALADAYGITGAAVATVTDNFEEFNNQIATSLDLSNQLKDAKIATNLARNTVNEHQIKDLPTVSFKTELEDQKIAQVLDTSSLMAEIIENSGNYTIADLLTDVTINKDNNGNLSFTGNELFNALYQARNADMNLPGQDMLRSLIESTIIDALNNGETVVDDKGLVRSQQKITNPQSLGAARYKTEYLDIDKTNLEDVIQLAIDNIGLFGGVEANSLLTGAYLDMDTTKLQSVLDVIVGEEESPIVNIDELIGDTYASLFDSNTKKLIWDNSASADEKVETFDLYKKWREELVDKLAGMADGPVKELGESLLNEINKIVNDPTLGKAVEEYKQARKSEEILKQAESLIKETVGKNIDNYNLEDYTLLWEKLQTSVDENKDTYNLTQYEPNSEEYIAARNKVIASIINDYTILDDWTNIYLSLAETFTEGSDEFKAALEYTKNLKPEEVTGDLLKALSIDISKTGKAGDYTDAVKIAQQANKEKVSMQQYATKASQVASTYKSGMDLEDASAIYATFFGEGKQELEGYTKDWEEFLKLDADARKTYLEGMSKAALNAAKEKASNSLTEANNAQTAFDNEYGALIKDEQATVAKEFAVDKDGQLKYIGQDLSKEAEARANLAQKAKDYGYDTDIEFVQQYANIAAESERIKQNIIAATNELKGYELLDDVGDTAVDRISRLGNMVSKLPEDAEEFNKLIGQLKNVKPIDLINMSELQRAETVLQTLSSEKPLEENFKLDNGEIDYGEYYKALQAWREANQQAADAIMNGANEAFAQIENRMNHAREEAEKIQSAAQILSDSIATGELTETQKIKIPENFLTDWEAAADASERAAVAMRMWNESARQQEEAANEILTTYGQASKLLYLSAHTLEKFNFSDEEQGKIDFARMLSESNMDKALMDVWLKAWDNVKANGKDFTNMSNRSIIETLRAEINNMTDLTEEQKKTIFASVADNMTNLFTELSNNTIEEAEKATQAWLNAFDAINKAKRTLMSGGNLAEQIAGNPEEFMRLMQNSNHANNPQEFYNAVMSGQITADNLGMKEDFPYQALYESKIGNSKLAKLYQDYQSIFNVGEVFNEMGYFSNRDMAQQTIEGFKRRALTPDEMNILYNTLVQAHKDDLVKQLGYTPSTDDKGKLIYKNAEDQIIAENVLKQAYMSAVTPLLDYFGEEYTEGDFDNIFFKMMDKGNMLLSIMELSTKAYQEQAKQQNTLTEVEHKADINNLVESQIQEQKIGINGQYGSYEEYQRLQEAIERAQEAKYSGESWESLSAEDQDILKQYNINFDNVDTSAQNCANALAACAQAAYALAEQALLAEGTGYTKEDGKYYYTTEDGIKAEVTAENNEAIKALQEAQNFANNASFEAQDTNYQTIERMASSVGMTADKFDQYAETLYKVNGGTKEFNELSATEKQELRDTARLSQMAAEGWKELKESQEDNIKTIKKGDKTTTDYYKSLSDLTTSVKKAFGGCEAVTEDFVESHMDDIEKMAKGDIEAAERIESALLMEDLGEDVFNREVKFDVDKNGVEDDLGTIGSMLSAFGDEWRDKPIGFEATLDNTPALAGLQQLLDSGYMTVDQMNAALATIGWAPEIEYEVIQASDQQEALTVGSLVAGSEVIKVDGKIVTKATGQIAIPKIKSARKTGGGSSGASRPSSGGKGGGGGSKTPEKKDKVRGRDEIERYHKQNDTIDRLASSIEKIDKLKDRAYGKDHIAQIEAETDALNKQLIAQQDLHDEALKWMAADKIDLAKYGAEYDENGTISNYETVMEHIIDEYNSAIERYNNSNQEEGDKLALEDAEQIFKDAKKAIENYEEALSVANDSANEMLEIQNKLSEIEVAKITYELELKINLNERDLELLQYYQDKYTDTLDKQDEVYNTILGSMLEYEDNLKALGEAYEELNRKRVLGLITEADYAEAVQDLQDQIIDNLSELNDIQNQLVDTYTKTLSLAREEVERTTDTIDSANATLQSYIDILALSGNEKDYEKMATFYEMMNENNLTKIKIQRDYLDDLLEREDKFQEKIRSGQQLTDLEKKEYQALQKEIFTARDALLSTTQEALGTIREAYENTINSISDNLDNFMADAAGSMAYLQEQYGYFQEEQDRYVSTAKELYEVSKLNRDIEKTLGETTSKAAKEALKALQEKINKQSELNELTEYDIEMNQLQYQLLLARIKLEEAQNAKDVVRLTRDENGNYAYRYTANQDKIDEAAQHYEDVLQQINDTTVQRTSEIEQQLLNTMSNYKEKLQEIATDYTLTEEERLMQLEDLNNNFAKTMLFIQEQNNIATENLTANQEAIAEHYGVNMSQITASTAGNVNETIQSMIDKTQEYIKAMNEAIFGEDGERTAWQKYLAGVGDITDAADMAYGTMVEDAEEMGEMNKWSAEQAQEVTDTLTDTLEPLEALTRAWTSHNAILTSTISNYESLAKVIGGVLAAVGEIPNATGTGEADGTSMPRFAKGGPVDYTGLAWVDGTPGNPEYVLNPGDTENILMAAATVKSMDSGFLGSLVESVKSAAHAMMNIFSNAYHAVGGVHTASTTLDQNVHITAEFPNVTDHNEIEEALLSLTNRASQFANQKK